MEKKIRVTVYNEFIHEQEYENIRKVYPDGIHGCIAAFLEEEADITVRTATFEMPEHGLSEEVLAGTDVLIFWSHARQDEFSDEVAERVRQHVLMGMGLLALHSAHFSKVLKKLLGTSMTLKWRHGDRERLWCIDPTHPIAAGIPENFEIGVEECYSEFFDVPQPDELIFLGWFDIGEAFRSGCTWYRGYGKVFYFQPGHETNQSFHNPYVRQIIRNACRWAAPTASRTALCSAHIDPTLEDIRKGVAQAEEEK